MKHITRFLGFGWVGLAVACASGEGSEGGAGGSQMVIEKGCVLTACEDLVKHSEYQCEECLSACSYAAYDCDLGSSCEYSCSTPSCSQAERDKCLIEGFEATLPNNPSSEVMEACTNALAHVSSCGYAPSFDYADCVDTALVARPEYASTFDCLAGVACGDLGKDEVVKQCEVAPSKFGTELCAKLSAKCPDLACDGESMGSLDALGQILRPDILEALDSCLKQATCENVEGCLTAWSDALSE